MRDPKRVAILISGRGSNMRALVEQAQNYRVVLVAANKPQAQGLEWAKDRGLATWCLDSKGTEKEAYDRTLSAALEDHGVGTIALAGFMRILSPWFVGQWTGRIVNIHPSLLPKYRGLDTHARAIAAGD
jgi:phosphoribosylglycinamide formyltransferase-1